MKEIKAYVRINMAEPVMEVLAIEGCRDFSLMEVRRIMPDLPRESYDFSVALGGSFERMMKLEIVCRDENAARLVAAIRRAAATGRPGDGKIFVSAVEQAVRIMNDQHGEGALSI